MQSGRLGSPGSTCRCVLGYNKRMDTRFDGIARFVAVTRLGSFNGGCCGSGHGQVRDRAGEVAAGGPIGREAAAPNDTPPDPNSRGRRLGSSIALRRSTRLKRGESALILARETPGGEVRIDLPTAFGRCTSCRCCLSVAKRYPALNLNVSFTDRRVDLIGENIDLAVRIGNLEDSTDLAARHIGVQQMVIVGAPSYLCTAGHSAILERSCRTRLHHRATARQPHRLADEATGRLDSAAGRPRQA